MKGLILASVGALLLASGTGDIKNAKASNDGKSPFANANSSSGSCLCSCNCINCTCSTSAKQLANKEQCKVNADGTTSCAKAVKGIYRGPVFNRATPVRGFFRNGGIFRRGSCGAGSCN